MGTGRLVRRLIVAFQVKDNSSLDWDGSRVGNEKWLDFGYIFQAREGVKSEI